MQLPTDRRILIGERTEEFQGDLQDGFARSIISMKIVFEERFHRRNDFALHQLLLSIVVDAECTKNIADDHLNRNGQSEKTRKEMQMIEENRQ